MDDRWLESGKITKWASKGGWAIADQSFFAGANFLAGVQVARWLSLSDFGAFSTAYSIFLFVSTFYTALWIEPMLLYGSGVFQESLHSYFLNIRRLHWYFSVLVAFCFAIAAMIVADTGWDNLAPALIGLVVATPLVLFLWLMRRYCYVILKPQLATLGGGFYLIFYLSGIYLVHRLDWLTSMNVFIVMGIASFFASLVIIRMALTVPADEDVVAVREIIHQHWRYGRWAILASGFWWVPSNLPYILLPLMLDFDASAILRAFYYLVMPVLQISLALGSLFLPTYTRLRNTPRLRFALLVSGVSLGGLALLYWLLLVTLGEPVVEFLYAGRYVKYLALINIIGFLPVFVALGSVFSNFLRSVERPDLVAWAYGIGAVSVIIIIYPLVMRSGIQGAALSWLIGQFLMFAFLFVASMRILSKGRS